MRPTLRPLLAAMLLALAMVPASAGALNGSVALGRSPDAIRLRPQDAVVWLDQVPVKTERQHTRLPSRWFRHRRTPVQLPRIVESRQRYSPHIIALAAGSALVIRNEDKVWHGTFSVSLARTFELGKRPPGRADTLSFDSTGVVALRCDIHPAMSAFVVVTPNHAFTQPDAGGRWRLPDLPAGHYVVRAWHPDKGELRREVNVPARGTTSLQLRW